MKRLTEKLSIWIVWLLPRVVVRWAFFRVMAHATTGKYGSTVAGDLKAFDAIDRWEKPNDSQSNHPFSDSGRTTKGAYGNDVPLCRHCDQSPAYAGHTVPMSA